MQREIKFRVWNYDDKCFQDSLSDWLKFRFNSIVPIFKTENIEIQQFTGLKDKNGKEIYEGDILEYDIPNNYQNSGKYMGIIEYGRGRFNIKEKSNFNDCLMGDKMLLSPAQDDGVIVGNIFENPSY